MKIVTMKKIALPLLLSASLFSGMTYAGGGNDRGHAGMMEHHMKRVLDKVDLTDAQEEQVDAIMDANFDDMKSDFTQVKSIDEELTALTQTDVLDSVAVDALLEQKLALIKTRMEKSIDARHQVWLVLTPEQQTKAKEIIANMKAKMEKRRAEKQHD